MTASLSAHHHTDLLIVGAGLCGLLLANTLAQSGRAVTLLDKGASVGGRLATRRMGSGRADHGAQFFTVRSAEFGDLARRWIDAGLIYQWSMGWGDGSLAEARADGYPRYAVRGGMNALAKYLAAQATAAGALIHTRARAAAATPDEKGWRVTLENGTEFRSQQLALTSPVPQSLALLDAGGTALTTTDRAALECIHYAPCLCGLFWVEGDVHLPDPGAVQQPNAPISWIADNQRKGISPGARLITLHGSPEWSRNHYDALDDEVLSQMRMALAPWMDANATIREMQVKRWRYALPTELHPQPYLAATGLPVLLFGGDAFGGPRIEGAALSGLAMATYLRVSEYPSASPHP